MDEPVGDRTREQAGDEPVMVPAHDDAGGVVLVGSAAELGSSVAMAGFERPPDVLRGEDELALDVHVVGGELSCGVERSGAAHWRDVEHPGEVGDVDGYERRVRSTRQLGGGPERVAGGG